MPTAHRFTPDEHSIRFNFFQFIVVTVAQLAVVLLAFHFLLPNLFVAELQNPTLLVGTAFVLGLPLSLFEYLYHRYLLHQAILPFMGIMHASHKEHHDLTNVKAPVVARNPDTLVPVNNRYAVESPEQEEAMMFPGYALSIFYSIFLILLALPLKLLFPQIPAILGTIGAVTCMYVGYEVWHAIQHFPYTRFWKPLLYDRPYSALIRRIYSFHLGHHFRPKSNLAVVGFWGWAVWDYMFGTHKRPLNLPLPGESVTWKDGELPKPRGLVKLLDTWQTPMFQWSRRVDTWVMNFFRRTKTPQ